MEKSKSFSLMPRHGSNSSTRPTRVSVRVDSAVVPLALPPPDGNHTRTRAPSIQSALAVIADCKCNPLGRPSSYVGIHSHAWVGATQYAPSLNRVEMPRPESVSD